MLDLDRLAAANRTTAWLGGGLQDRTDWIRRFTAAEIDDLDSALRRFQAGGIPLERAAVADFPLPVLGPTLRELLTVIHDGRGFVVLRGLPVARYTDAEVGIMFYGLGLHLGRPLLQNPRGDLLGHVFDQGRTYGNIDVRGYETNAYLPFHTDGCELVGLLCLRKARSGGISALSSATAVYLEIARRHPEYLPALHAGYRYIRREAALTEYAVSGRIPIYGVEDGLVSCRCVPNQIEAAAAKLGTPLEGLERAALDLFRALTAAEPYRLDMDLEQGDIQLCNNYTILHSRTAFEDWAEPERRRHMLRLWLAFEQPRPLPGYFPRQLGYQRNTLSEVHLQHGA